MSQNHINENEIVSQDSNLWNRDYSWLFSEENYWRLDDIINISRLLEDLLDSKAEMKCETSVSAGQMSSLFRVMLKELNAIKSELHKKDGIFSQGEVDLGLNAVRVFGVHKVKEMIDKAAEGEH
ncbi:hypothetical protein [Citrobacter freundii]|uniref:hypothetical protein n=1 Tax=Citrobacter freundii TaxID=546 RepID=UPI003F8E674C